MPPDDDWLLERCLFCGYPLTGLPSVHRCPECGRGFDRNSRLFRREQEWQRLPSWRLASLVFLPAVATMMTVLALAGRGGNSCSLSLALALWGFWGAMLLSWLRTSPRLVAIGRSGISVCDRRARIQDYYPWSDVQGAGLDLRPDGFFLYLKDRSVWIAVLGDDAMETKDCVECINGFLRDGTAVGNDLPGQDCN